MYYTFSTIAQVLAGFLALSSVFILYKIQWYSKIQLLNIKAFVNGREQEYKYDKLSGYIFTNYIEKLSDVFESGLPSQAKYLFVKLLQDGTAKQYNSACIYKAEYFFDNIKKLEHNKQRLLFMTLISLIIGVITIIYSLIVLALVNQISDSNYRNIYIVSGIIGAVLCLVVMSIAIIQSLYDKTEHLTLEKLSSPI